MTRSAPQVSRHVSVWIEASRKTVYAFAADQRTLAEWATGLADPELGLEVVEFAPPNEFGVLDHVVRLPSGEQVFNALRIIPADDGIRCEAVFTLRQRADQTDEQFDEDAAAVTQDLLRLKRLTER